MSEALSRVQAGIERLASLPMPERAPAVEVILCDLLAWAQITEVQVATLLSEDEVKRQYGQY